MLVSGTPSDVYRLQNVASFESVFSERPLMSVCMSISMKLMTRSWPMKDTPSNGMATMTFLSLPCRSLTDISGPEMSR